MQKTIVYIISDQRSGSTLLEQVLSCSYNVNTVGELIHLHDYLKQSGVGWPRGWQCQCGEPVNTCQFWSDIMCYADLDIRTMLPTKLTNNIGRHEENREKNERINQLDIIYDALFEKLNCSVLIDSSKNVYQAIELSKYSRHHYRFIYLTRDMRAVTLSKRKWRKIYGQEIPPLLRNLAAVLRKRIKYNNAVEVLGPNHITIQYEKLVKNYPEYLRLIWDFVANEWVNVVVPDTVGGSKGHTIAGTPNRNKVRGIVYDDTWRRKSKERKFFNLIGYMLELIV